MSSDAKGCVSLISLGILLAIFFALGCKSGFDRAFLNARIEAVERGFAEWVPDKESNTTFKWKEVAK